MKRYEEKTRSFFADFLPCVCIEVTNNHLKRNVRMQLWCNQRSSFPGDERRKATSYIHYNKIMSPIVLSRTTEKEKSIKQITMWEISVSEKVAKMEMSAVDKIFHVLLVTHQLWRPMKVFHKYWCDMKWNIQERNFFRSECVLLRTASFEK